MLCDRCCRPLDDGEHGVYKCPLEPRRMSHFIWSDDIPGGLTIAHGLCNEDGTPRTYYSWTEINAHAKAKGLMNWGEKYSEDRLKDARVRDDWQQSSEAKRAKRDRDEARKEQALARTRR